MGDGNFLPNISSDEIKELDLKSFEGDIILVENINQLQGAIKRIEKFRILGFDTETRPSFKKGKKNKVSLIQLADDKTAFLIRINKIGIPEQIAQILSDPGVVKCGVAIHDDIKTLSGVRKFIPAGFVDLQPFVKNYGIDSSGLKKLAAIVLGFRISKRQQVTDWESDVLTEAQLIYAATDAWVCYKIYKKLTGH